MLTPAFIHKSHLITGLLIAMIFFAGINGRRGFAKGDDMGKADFQVSVDARNVKFTEPPVFKNDTWLVPLKPFAEQLGLKVELLQGTQAVVLCGGVETELCLQLQFQDGEKGAVDIEGITYVSPTHIAENFGFEIYKVSEKQLEIIHPAHLAPELSFLDLQETPKTLRDFQGKKTFLYVWGSW